MTSHNAVECDMCVSYLYYTIKCRSPNCSLLSYLMIALPASQFLPTNWRTSIDQKANKTKSSMITSLLYKESSVSKKNDLFMLQVRTVDFDVGHTWCVAVYCSLLCICI